MEEKFIFEKEECFVNAKSRAQEIYGRMIPYVIELLEVIREEKVEEGLIASINIDADGYARIYIPNLGFYVYRFGEDDFTLTLDTSYAEKLKGKAGVEDA